MDKNHQLAIILERSMHDLYVMFSEKLPEHNEFWKRLASEENEHIDFLKATSKFKDLGNLNFNVIVSSENEIIMRIYEVQKNIEDIKNQPISIFEACNLAVKLESVAQEYHFFKLKSMDSDDILFNTFKNLYSEDKSHIKLLLEYLYSIKN